MTTDSGVLEKCDIVRHNMGLQQIPDKKYRVQFTHLDPEDRKRFKNSKCMLSISLGHDYSEGKKLEGVLKLIGMHFQSCIILIGDTLSRHSISIFHPQKPKQEVYAMAEKDGNMWIERNQRFFSEALKIPFSVLRWKSLLEDPNFKSCHDKVIKLYTQHTEFARVINDTAENFCNRVIRREPLLNVSKARQSSLEYIFEECAASYLYVNTKCEFELYPGTRNEAMNFVYDNFIRLNNSGLIKPINICIKRK